MKEKPACYSETERELAVALDAVRERLSQVTTERDTAKEALRRIVENHNDCDKLGCRSWPDVQLARAAYYEIVGVKW